MQVRPSQISPGENFDIFYFLRNHTDSTTYFIRAVVYDVRTGDILQTINLTQSPNNARLFTKTVLAPADPGSYGRNIVAVATVYTDSGYTTKSTDYEEQEQYFLVRAVMTDIVGGGGGIDHRTLREVLQEELGKLPKAGAVPDMPFDAIFGAIGALQREINRVPKELAAVDLSGLSGKLGQVLSALTGIEASIAALPPPERLDLSPVLSELSALADSVNAIDDRVAGTGDAQVVTVKRAVTEALTGLKKTITDAINSHEISIPVSGMAQSKEPTPSPIDVSHLM